MVPVRITIVISSSCFRPALRSVFVGAASAQFHAVTLTLSNLCLRRFKLPEWLQVEFVEDFARFMHVAPWFRFPFMRTLRLYADVLRQEFEVVKARYGVSRAGLSMGFATSAIPGVVMAMLFGFLNFLAIPCNLAFGANFDGERYSAESMARQRQTIVLTVDPAAEQLLPTTWNQVHPAISRGRRAAAGIHVLEVPAFEAFTEVIIALARLPVELGTTLLRIADQNEIQTRVVVPGRRSLALLKTLPGSVVEFDFGSTTEAGGGVVNAACGVEVPALLQFIQSCQQLGFEVTHVYDFYG